MRVHETYPDRPSLALGLVDVEEEKMTVFAVTETLIEDYIVHGIFSTRELADAFVVELCKGNTDASDVSVEEWLLDEKAGWIHRLKYTCQIRISDGGLNWQNTYHVELPPGEEIAETVIHPEYDIIYGHSTVDEGRALALAEAARAQHVAVEVTR